MEDLETLSGTFSIFKIMGRFQRNEILKKIRISGITSGSTRLCFEYKDRKLTLTYNDCSKIWTYGWGFPLRNLNDIVTKVTSELEIYKIENRKKIRRNALS